MFGVGRWSRSVANKWENLEAYLKEIEKPNESEASKLFDEIYERKEREAKDAFVDFAIVKDKVKISYRNVRKASLNFYKADLELLFSQSPFTSDLDAFSLIKPNESKSHDLPKAKTEAEFVIPKEYFGCNSIVEVAAGATKVSKPLFDHKLTVQVEW